MEKDIGENILDEFIGNIKQGNQVKTKVEARMMSPLVLAYVGDAVFELFIRNYLVNTKKASVNVYHKESTNYVRAKAQSEIVHALEAELTEEEWTIVKRGRNQKSVSVPKNANSTDYRYATGFEALLGYLFYIGDYKKLMLVMDRSIEIIQEG